MPSRRPWVPAVAVAVTAFLAILGYEAGRAGAGHDPAIPAASQPATSTQQSVPPAEATPPTTPAPNGALVPPSDPQGPVTRAS